MKFSEFLGKESILSERVLEVQSERDLMIAYDQLKDDEIPYGDYIDIAGGYVISVFDALHEIVREKYQRKLSQVQVGSKRSVEPLDPYEKNDQALRDFLGVFLFNVHSYKRDLNDKFAKQDSTHRDVVLKYIKKNQEDLIKLVRKAGVKV